MQMQNIGLSDFKDIIKIYRKSGHPGRDFFLWQDDIIKLRKILPDDITIYKFIDREIIDTHTEPPIDESEARNMLSKKLEKFLWETKKQNKSRQILVLSEFYLLMRYNIEPSIFFENYISDDTMLVALFKPVFEKQIEGINQNLNYNPEKLIYYFDHSNIKAVEVEK